MFRLALITSVALLLLTPLAAQERLLTFSEAYAYTLEHNPSMIAAHHALQAAGQERRAAIGLRLPQIGLTGAYTYLGRDIGFDLNGLKRPIEGIMGNLTQSGLIPPSQLPQLQQLLAPVLGSDWFLSLQDRSTGFVGGQVIQPIYLGGKINTANRAARINEQIAVQQSDQNRHTLTTQLVERYYGLVLARQAVRVREQVMAGMRQHLADAIKLEENGMISRSERLYVEFKLSEAERELQDARLKVEMVQSALDNTLGGEFGSVNPVSNLFLLEGLEGLAWFQRGALESNPQLQEVASQRALAAEGVKLQRAEFLPQVTAMGGGSFYNYQVTDILPRWAVGVGVSLKIFDGLNREYKYSAARQTLRRVEALERQAASDITLLVEQHYNEVMNCANRMESIEASLAFAEEYLHSIHAAFLEGMRSSTELIDAELNLAGVRIERMENAFRYDLALARLLEAVGMSDRFIELQNDPCMQAIQFENE